MKSWKPTPICAQEMAHLVVLCLDIATTAGQEARDSPA
jgi:hypothetical protein